RKRRGGFGVYYHASYLGRPLSYLWLNTTPPALVWEEMSKAYEHGARRLWMLNVGDIKPGEVAAEFFMQMAWDSTRWRRDNLPDFLKEWARREFGPARADEIAAVMDEYYRLGFARKPEHLQWYLPGEKERLSDFAHFDYGDEARARLVAYDSLLRRVSRLYQSMPAEQRDAFYELVVYPVRGAAFANHRFFGMEKAALYAAQGRASAAESARLSQEYDRLLAVETAVYNERLAGGKWRHMMRQEMGPGQWKSMRSTPPVIPPALAEMKLTERAGLGVAVEGRAEPVREGERDAALPALSAFTRDTRFVDIFNTGRAPAKWTAKASHGWIKLGAREGDLSEDARLVVSVDWARAPRGDAVAGEVLIEGAGSSRVVKVPVFNPRSPRPEKLSGFVESNGVVSIEAEHFTRSVDRAGAAWRVIPGLGRTGDSVAVFPTDAAGFELERVAKEAPALEYEFHLFTPGELKLTCYLVPTHPVGDGRGGLRFAVGVDGEAPRPLAASAGVEVTSRGWAENVLNATTLATASLRVGRAGRHVLRVYMLDPGVVIDKIVLDAGGARPSYLGPPETRVAAR
ncbi:MAG TPA: glycosyl hydrolase 115 family protein, partial [Pyrinomonadaceae bacterium]|nr:glycosyl hydrolase 115 family protein [Pyrinomonadaceae bacterium]